MTPPSPHHHTHTQPVRAICTFHLSSRILTVQSDHTHTHTHPSRSGAGTHRPAVHSGWAGWHGGTHTHTHPPAGWGTNPPTCSTLRLGWLAWGQSHALTSSQSGHGPGTPSEPWEESAEEQGRLRTVLLALWGPARSLISGSLLPLNAGGARCQAGGRQPPTPPPA